MTTYEATIEAITAEALEQDVDRLHAEAMHRTNGDAYRALEWLCYDWRGPLQYALSSYEDRVQERVRALLRSQLTVGQREAWDNEVTADEYQGWVSVVRVKHERPETTYLITRNAA